MANFIDRYWTVYQKHRVKKHRSSLRSLCKSKFFNAHSNRTAILTSEEAQKSRVGIQTCPKYVSSTGQSQSSDRVGSGNGCWDLRNDSQLARSPGFVVKIASASVDHIIETRSAFIACPAVPHRINRLLFNVGRVTGEASRHVPLPLRWKLKSFGRIWQRASVCVYFHKTTARTEARRLRIGEFARGGFLGVRTCGKQRHGPWAALRGALHLYVWSVRAARTRVVARIHIAHPMYVRTYVRERGVLVLLDFLVGLAIDFSSRK